MSIPHLFRCPISLDLFTDPVTLPTGQTYDRPSIEKWLAAGNSTCPVTMQRLSDTSVVPNRTLRHLIDEWLLSVPDPNSNCISFKLTRLAQPTSTGTAPSLASLKQTLQSPETDTSTKIGILKKVRILAVESDTGNACLIQLGYFPLLVQLLLFPNQILALVEVVVDCIVSLSDSAELDPLNKIKTESNLSAFLHLLEQGNARMKTSLCLIMEKITSTNVNRELSLILGQSRRVVQVIVALLQTQNEAAVRAISGICSFEANRCNAIRTGAIDGLVAYLMSSDRKINGTLMALATLEGLVGVEVGKKAIVKNPDAIRLLVKLVFRVSSNNNTAEEVVVVNEGSEHAVGVLLVACCQSAKVRAEAVKAGVLTQVLLLLQSQCGGKGKAKARALLRLLRSMWIRDPGFGANLLHVM